MSETGDRLLAALRQNPALAFEVLQATRAWKLAGPWHQPEAYKKVRFDETGATLVRVAKNKDRHAMFQWEVSCSKRVGSVPTVPDGDDRLKKGFPSEYEAVQWADATLASFGFLLA